MENKILRLTTSSLFALQGAFAIFWSLYMYLEDNMRLTEAFVIGCILLLFALLFNFRKPIIKKTAYAVLVLYTVFFDVCGIMLIGVGSPVIWIAWVIFFLIVSNSALILLHYLSIQMTTLLVLSMIILAISSMLWNQQAKFMTFLKGYEIFVNSHVYQLDWFVRRFVIRKRENREELFVFLPDKHYL